MAENGLGGIPREEEERRGRSEGSRAEPEEVSILVYF